MNESRHIDEILQDLLEGELSPSEAERVQTHVSSCERCARMLDEFHEVAHDVKALPSGIEPPRDLWPSIQADLEEDAVRDGAADPASHGNGAVRLKGDLSMRLAPRRQANASPRQGDRTSIRSRRRRRRITVGVLAGIAVLFAAVVITSVSSDEWGVEPLAGTPRIAGSVISGSGSMQAGDWLTTDKVSRARLRAGVIGDVDVEPDTRIQLRQTRLSDHRIALESGQIHARIWAPPRLFIVETPAATAVDLGCVYTLTVDTTGRSLLHVQSGYVELEREGRSSIVPAGAMAIAHREVGPGTAFANDASPRLREALERYDFKGASSADLSVILSEARAEDAVTLWQILERGDAETRKRVYKRLVELVTPPSGVSMNGIVEGNDSMLRRWRMHLGLEALSWWGYLWRKLAFWDT